MQPAALLLAAVLMAADPAPDAELVRPAFDVGLQVTATAYTSGPESTGKRPGHPQYGYTYSGTRPRQGRTIAVDPKLIPLGSLVYIQELGQYRVAEDTGGAIHGNRIDLYMDRVPDAVQWGVRNVRIQVSPKL